MKTAYISFGLLLLIVTDLVASADEAKSISVMTFNIRYGTAPDGDNSWPLRKSLVLEVIRNSQPHMLGLQEALREQLDEITEALPQLVATGVGREADGGGEYSALLYDRRRFDLLAGGTFWLSENPQVRGSHTWGNELPRICTWAQLVDRTSGKSIRVLNTHWDHQSQPARVRSGELVAAQISEFGPEEPVILMGDFNADPDNPARQPFSRIGLKDTYFDLHPSSQDIGTFHAFQGTTSGEKIDAIYVNDRWKVLDAAIDHTHSKGRYPSDHFPVTATLELKRE